MRVDRETGCYLPARGRGHGISHFHLCGFTMKIVRFSDLHLDTPLPCMGVTSEIAASVKTHDGACREGIAALAGDREADVLLRGGDRCARDPGAADTVAASPRAVRRARAATRLPAVIEGGVHPWMLLSAAR